MTWWQAWWHHLWPQMTLMILNIYQLIRYFHFPPWIPLQKISVPFRVLSLSFPITVHSRWPLDDLPMTSDITLKNQTWFSWYYVVFHIVSLTIELSCTRSGNVPNRTITKTRSRFWGTNQNQKKRIFKICYRFAVSHFSVFEF